MPDSNSTVGLGELLVIGVFALGIGGGTALTDVDPAVTLHNEVATNTNNRFDKSKEQLYTTIERNADDTVDCIYSATQADLEEKSPGLFKPKRSQGVHAEHVWACKAEWVESSGFHFDRERSIPGADLHNLYPARAGPNISRSAHRFGVVAPGTPEFHIKPSGFKAIPGEPGSVGTGSFSGKDLGGVSVFEPRPDARGNVARALFYMSVRYWLEIPDDMEDLLRQWHEDDPVDAEERERNDLIESIQSNRNPFIDDGDLVAEIGDF